LSPWQETQGKGKRVGEGERRAPLSRYVFVPLFWEEKSRKRVKKRKRKGGWFSLTTTSDY